MIDKLMVQVVDRPGIEPGTPKCKASCGHLVAARDDERLVPRTVKLARRPPSSASSICSAGRTQARAQRRVGDRIPWTIGSRTTAMTKLTDDEIRALLALEARGTPEP